MHLIVRIRHPSSLEKSCGRHWLMSNIKRIEIKVKKKYSQTTSFIYLNIGFLSLCDSKVWNIHISFSVYYQQFKINQPNKKYMNIISIRDERKLFEYNVSCETFFFFLFFKDNFTGCYESKKVKENDFVDLPNSNKKKAMMFSVRFNRLLFINC